MLWKVLARGCDWRSRDAWRCVFVGEEGPAREEFSRRVETQDQALEGCGYRLVNDGSAVVEQSLPVRETTSLKRFDGI